ncbi:unnamed protein product [Nesidiocoris tenuis]|uniref:Uncharacterized protein n=1 Tax=Nesidiocoris tenuis TaxID=355587 RepID=A0A6H5GRP7_9HEMI|nr:unnamed protein product [Nesidiocoris tenuis]
MKIGRGQDEKQRGLSVSKGRTTQRPNRMPMRPRILGVISIGIYRRRSGETSYLHFVKTVTIPMVPYVTTLNFHDISNVHVQVRNWRYEISPLRRRYTVIETSTAGLEKAHDNGNVRLDPGITRKSREHDEEEGAAMSISMMGKQSSEDEEGDGGGGREDGRGDGGGRRGDGKGRTEDGGGGRGAGGEDEKHSDLLKVEKQPYHMMKN